MFWQTAFTASLLVARAYAGIADLVAEGVLTGRSTADLVRRMDTSAIDAIEPLADRHIVVKRVTASSAGVVLNGDGSVNMTAWEAQVNDACNKALTKLPESSNPSGTCICYNIPVLDNSTGAFEADLRLYQLSEPSGQFAGIPPEKIQVGLSYIGASVSPVTAQTAQKLVSPRQAPAAPAAAVNEIPPNGLRLLQTYLFVGQIDKAKMTEIMNSNKTLFDAQLEALIMPTLTLTAVNPSGQTIATNVSSNEAAFVAGVFSNDIVLSDFARAQLAVDDVVLQLALFTNGTSIGNNTIAFVLPGVQILIFPIGLVIYSFWLLVGCIVFGMGTIQRMNFREQFRRRTAVAGGKSSARI